MGYLKRKYEIQVLDYSKLYLYKNVSLVYSLIWKVVQRLKEFIYQEDLLYIYFYVEDIVSFLNVE